MDVKIKRLYPDSMLPEYKHADDSGMDLHAYVTGSDGLDWNGGVDYCYLNPGERKIIKTGIAIAMTSKHMEAQVRPRSGLAAKNGIMVVNTPGTIDAGYRGEIGVILYNSSGELFKISHGDRIAQLVFVPIIKANLIEVEDLDETERGSGAYGSTGKS